MRKYVPNFLTQSAMVGAVLSGGILSGPAVAMEDEPLQQQVVVITADDAGADDADADAEEHAPKLWLGIMLKEIDGDLARYLDSTDGILVDSVVEGSPAEKGGIKEGDILKRVGETQLGDPLALMKVLADLGEKSQSLKITLLRRGEEKTVEVTPAERPDLEEIVVDVEELHADLQDAEKAEGAAKRALQRLRIGEAGKDMNIFRFGSPSMIFRGRGKDAKAEGDMEAVIVKEVDGNKIEVKVIRKDDKPATITVTKDGKVSEYTEENLKEMPEEIAVIVEPMIEGHTGIRIGDFHIVGPDWKELELGDISREEIVKKAREMADKQRANADILAEKARQSAAAIRERAQQAGSKVAEEVDELRTMVEALREEIAKLRSELKDKDGTL